MSLGRSGAEAAVRFLLSPDEWSIVLLRCAVRMLVSKESGSWPRLSGKFAWRALGQNTFPST